MEPQQTITLPIPAEFTAFCRANGRTPVQVLAAFIADLADTADTNGSDERMHANNWFDRVIWPERTYRVEPRPAELGEGWKVMFLEDDVEVGGGVFPVDPDAVSEEDRRDASEEARCDAEEEGERWVGGLTG